tara:strand:+ start:543 stop:1076 length:534 start_codon:yes stop_codon:yes gene_type:complete
VQTRRCCGCGKTHPLTKEFFRGANRRGVVGYTHKCRECFRQVYEAHKLENAAYRKIRYEANKEETKKRRRRVNLPPEKVAKLKEQNRASYWRNPERARAAAAKWRRKNPEKVLQGRVDGCDREKEIARSRHNREALTDVYVREILVKHGSRQIDIPQGLIEVKRMHLKLQRAVKDKG